MDISLILQMMLFLGYPGEEVLADPDPIIKYYMFCMGLKVKYKNGDY